MGVYKTLAKNTFVVFLGTIGSKLIYVLMLPLYTRWLSPDDFGVVDSVTTYSMLIIGFVCLCLPDAIFVFPRGASREEQRKYFSSGMAFSIVALICGAILFAGCNLLIRSLGYENVYTNYTWSIFWMMVSAYFQNYLQSFSRSIDLMVHYSISGIVLTFFIALLSFLLIPTYGLMGYVAAIVLAQFISAAYSFVTAKCHHYMAIQAVNKGSLKQMLSYSAPLLPNGIMWWLVNGLNRPVMEAALGLSAIGIFAVANKIAGTMYALLSILSLAWNNSALDEYGKPGFEKFYNNYLKFVTTFLFVGACLITILSKPIIELITTPEYYDAYRYMPLLSMGIVFAGFAGIVGSIFSATKQSKYFFYSSVWGGISSVVVLLALTKPLGLFGVSIAVVMSFFVLSATRVLYAWKYTKSGNLPYYFSLVMIYIGFYLVNILGILDEWKYVVDIVLCLLIILITYKDFSSFTKILISKIKRNG